MIEIFQNIFALSVQVGILIGIVLLLGHFVKRPYIAVGRYFLWLALALRLLIPINLEWMNIEELGQGVQNLWSSEKEEQVMKEVTDKDDTGYKENLAKETGRKEKSVYDQSVKKVSEKEQILESEIDSNGILSGTELKNESSSKLGFSDIMVGIKDWYEIHKNLIWTIMSILWLFGIVGMLGYEVIIYQSVYRSIRRWRRVAPTEYQKQFALVCQEMHISKRIPVYQCSKVESPMIVGLWRPSIILPERKYPNESLYYIYKHELTHFCHGDLYYKLIQIIVRCIYWFHPLIHAMYHQASFDVELVCDEKVTKNQSETFCQEYSFVLLDTLTTQNQRTFPLSTCFFNGGREQMKERFKRIMGQNKKKYGLGLFGLLIVCAVILGNISLHPKKNSDYSKTNVAQAGTSSSKENEIKLSEEKLTSIKNILIVGVENISNSSTARADMNLLVTLNPYQKKCYVTEIARDLAITCEGKYTKVSGAYQYKMDRYKEAMEKEMGIAIDSTIEVNFQQFENVIDAVGGINLTLTKKEADYLNSTNYIREEKYRNVKKGKQLLNGQQVLGYARVRRVKSGNGQNGAFGRGERALNIVSAMCQRMKEMDRKNWISMASKVYDIVKTSQLDMETVYQMMQAVLTDGYIVETQQIPEEGAYVEKLGDIGCYLEYDFSSSKTLWKIKRTESTKENEDGVEVNFLAGVVGEGADEVNISNGDVSEATEDVDAIGTPDEEKGIQEIPYEQNVEVSK